MASTEYSINRCVIVPHLLSRKLALLEVKRLCHGQIANINGGPELEPTL